jgi:LysM repeat protein
VATPAYAADVVHVVQPGENLYRIALRYGVTVNAIAQANGLTNTRRIYVGQRLVIPTSGSPSSPPASSGGVHVVQRGENLYRIALRYGTTVQALATANGIVNTGRIYTGQRLVIPGHSGTPPSTPPASGQTYVVRRGDTLSAIALRYGVSVWSIAQLNVISNPSLIYVGQVLRIPDGGSPSPPSPSPPSPAPNSGRWIDVDLSAQRLTAYEGSTAVRSTLVSTGLPRTPTPTGKFRIYVKYRATLMSGPGYYLPDVPYTMYFYKGYGIHGTYWHSNFGHPMSHGCINLPTPEAQWLYNWASVGTLVNIHY